MYIQGNVVANPAVSPVVPRARVRHRQPTAECRPTKSVAQLSSLTHPVLSVRAKNRRYAAVLSHLSGQTDASSSESSSAFSGYVPKCNRVECSDAVTKSVSSGSTEQRKTKVSFCVDNGTRGERRSTTVVSSRCVSTVSSSAASVTSVTVTSTTSSKLPMTSANCSQLQMADSSLAETPADLSLLCAELFVDNNSSFCDQLLDTCSLPYDQPTAPNALLSSSFTLKDDIPEPVTDLAFDDFVDFDELFNCN